MKPEYKKTRLVGTQVARRTVPMASLVATFALLISTVLMIGPVRADHEGGNWDNTLWNDDHVIVFSDCGFAGNAKSIPAGDFARMKGIGVNANAISSIIIPDGLAVEIFQKRDFGGHWYRLNRSQDCLKGNWNDRIGSMRVVPDNVKNSFGFSDGYGQSADRCFPFTVRARRGEGGFRLVDSERRLTPIATGRTIEGEVCDQDTVRVELAKRDQDAAVVLKIAGEEYRFRRNDAYDDFRRDWYRQYLTIDLPDTGDSDDTQYGRGDWGNTRGFGPRYSSGIASGDNWGNDYKGRWYRGSNQAAANNNTGNNSSAGQGNSGNLGSACVPYRVIGNDQDTGIRFLTGDQQFYRVNNGSITGDLCQVGAVRVELAKKSVGATVVLQIGGDSYIFRGGDKGNQFQNGWYRKYLTINVR